MNEKIAELFEIIKDYRHSDGLMSLGIIKEWINQFDEEDRLFFLSETVHIMKKRYISESSAYEFIKIRIPYLTETNQYQTCQDFLKDVIVIDNQPEGKSQKVLLEMFYKVCRDEYNIDLQQHKNLTAKNYLYIDDILCTGDTLYKSLTGPIEKDYGGFFYEELDAGKPNITTFIENSATLRLIYFCIHQKNITKVINRTSIKMNRHPNVALRVSISFNYSYLGSLFIDNTENTNSKMELLVPSSGMRNETILQCEQHIKEKLSLSPYYREAPFFYRDDNKPEEEFFFSSKENRYRYEKILVEKCIEIYNSSYNFRNSNRPRPLGFGLNFDNSLGFGAMVFTWRNAPYNTPLVFWYKGNGWLPLFERNHT